MPEIDNLCTDPGFEQVTLKFTPRDVREIVTTRLPDDSSPETIRMFSLLRAAHEAFTSGEDNR